MSGRLDLNDLRYPVVWPNLLTDKLRWKLCEKKRAVEDGHAVIVDVGTQAKVVFTGGHQLNCLSLK